MITVTVAHSPAAREVVEQVVTLREGATVRDALQASGLAGSMSSGELRGAGTGVWGRKASLEQVLREGDRVELYRPLQVDPKLARRERFARQGGRTGGLFARGQNRRGR